MASLSAAQSEHIENELAHVRLKHDSLRHCTLITCLPAQVQVRFRVSETAAKTMDVCLQFPADYPKGLILIELKTKTLPDKFLAAADAFVAKHERQIKENDSGQILAVIRLVIDYLLANPLCVCAAEISNIKSKLTITQDEATSDSLKIKQSKKQLILLIRAENYFLQCLLYIPDNYPTDAVQIELIECNYPAWFSVHFDAQAAEIARLCVTPPATKMLKVKKKPVPFELKPSLLPVAEFLIESVKRYPNEPCGLCNERCLPKQAPKEWTWQAAKDLFRSEQLLDASCIDRVYCGHIFHNTCLDVYMKTPPFDGGKKCPKCNQVIYHEKWKTSQKTREERWAHKQAKQRELEEVADFLQ